MSTINPNFTYIPPSTKTQNNLPVNNNISNNSINIKAVDTPVSYSFNSLINSNAYDNKFNGKIKDAISARVNGDLDKAIGLYSEIYSQNNRELRALTGLADCYSRKGQFDEAYNYINKAKKIAPNLDNIARIEKNIFFSPKNNSGSNKFVSMNLRKHTANSSLETARKMVETHSPALKVALDGVPVNFGEIDPDAVGQSDGFVITLNENILGTAAPSVIAAVIAHEAVHSGDRDYFLQKNKDSISEEADAFEQASKVWEAYKGNLVDLNEDETSKIIREEGRKGLENFIKDLYKGNHAAKYMYSPGHYEEKMSHVQGAVTCKTKDGFVALNTNV